jgi:hypothetical protein
VSRGTNESNEGKKVIKRKVGLRRQGFKPLASIERRPLKGRLKILGVLLMDAAFNEPRRKSLGEATE